MTRRLPGAEFSRALAEARTAFRRLTRLALWDVLRNPLVDTHTRFQHWAPASLACSEAELLAAGVTPAVERRIVEQPHAFARGRAGDTARAAATATYEQLAHADARLPAQFPPRPGSVQAPDNLSAVSVFRGVTTV